MNIYTTGFELNGAKKAGDPQDYPDNIRHIVSSDPIPFCRAGDVRTLAPGITVDKSNTTRTCCLLLSQLD